MDARTTRLVFIVIGIAWLAIVGRALLNAKDESDFEITATDDEVAAFAREQLGSLQERSFAEGTELCGIIFENSDGELGSTPLRTGEAASCDIAYFDMPGMAPVASYHSHGAFGKQYDSEVPSLLDFDSDVASGLDGYVSTPGGRLWRIDAGNEEAVQLCGPGCLDQDPAYAGCRGDPPAERYTRRELRARRASAPSNC